MVCGGIVGGFVCVLWCLCRLDGGRRGSRGGVRVLRVVECDVVWCCVYCGVVLCWGLCGCGKSVFFGWIGVGGGVVDGVYVRRRDSRGDARVLVGGVFGKCGDCDECVGVVVGVCLGIFDECFVCWFDVCCVDRVGV